jgi:multiple sugar transport system ATP-binding protein
MASIKWENLTKDFGRVIAVNNLNLECADGEFLALLGPSGCGKTTTLRMTAGLETPTEGAIYFDEKPINHLSPRERNVAMVFENYALYPHKKVFKNIAYPLELRNMPEQEIDQKVRHAAKLLEIDTLLDRYPKEISGGQKQRVGIARALVREPVAFAMDEPLSHLDAKLRAYMRAELKRLQKELGITTVFVTHDQLEAMTMADRVAVMDRGVLQQHGTPQELFHQPASVFVAKFIGEPAMNLLPCERQDEGERSYLVGENVKIELSREMRHKAQEQATGKRMLLGVRPQHMLLQHAGQSQANGRNIVSGTVYVAEPLGTEQLVRVRVGSELVQVLTGDQVQVAMDEHVLLEVPPDRFFLFDAETEKRIA